MLDLSEIVSDPAFTQAVTRVQRVQTVNGFGETTTGTVSSTIQAVITSPGKLGMQRFADLQTYADVIQVTTTSRLNGPAVGQQPDLIIWQGQTYVVAVVNDYAAFGFSRAVCKLTDPQGQPHA